jgi:lipopolysaccharide transport system permease protein
MVRQSPLSATATPAFLIQPSRGLFHLDFRSLWQYRELLYFLVWRDVKVRYKQTAIGAVWAVVQPLLAMAVFTVIFSQFARIPSDGLPYPLFVFTALLPWTYFAQATNQCARSVVGDASLVSKVFFPRLIIPLAATIVPAVDFFFSLLVLLGLMAWFKTAPSWAALMTPLLLILAMATALAVGLFLSALNVRYRDVGQAVPFLVQIWMYASPVVYSVSLIPERWRLLYGLNPMVGVIEGFRWGLLGKAHPNFAVMAASAVVVLFLLVAGLIYFKQMERSFADVV